MSGPNAAVAHNSRSWRLWQSKPPLGYCRQGENLGRLSVGAFVLCGYRFRAAGEHHHVDSHCDKQGAERQAFLCASFINHEYSRRLSTRSNTLDGFVDLRANHRMRRLARITHAGGKVRGADEYAIYTVTPAIASRFSSASAVST